MVYYYTSKNVKFIRGVMQDYQKLNEISPQEYTKEYFERCRGDIEDSKLSWIIKSFLGIHKHSQFIKKTILQFAVDLSEEDKDFFTIILHGIIFQISPKDKTSLYKCMFNLSKTLLETFTKTLSNIENLPLILKIAEDDYDKAFVTENIYCPLFSWNPFIDEMNQTYKEHVNQIETSKRKIPTKPINMNVLNRAVKTKIKDTTPNIEEDSDIRLNILPDRRSKMLTNSKIRQNLDDIKLKNKIKALNLYNDVINNNLHYTQKISIKKKTDIEEEEEEDINIKHKRIFTPIKILNSAPQIKSTAANLKRISERIKRCEQEEIKWLQDIVEGAGNACELEELLKCDRQEKERKRLLDIERKHLMGQISHEEAVIARKKVVNENKIKYEQYQEEKKNWEKVIEEWKLKELKHNREVTEKISLIELEVANSRNNAALKRKEMAERIRQDNKEIKQNIMKTKQAELERKAEMIKEIKILFMIAKKSKMPKIIDLTQSSGIGLLCEMSIAELQERLVAIKIGLLEELDEKRSKIKTLNLEKKQELEETKKEIDQYMSHRAEKRRGTKIKPKIDMPLTKEICQLKNLLQEKRNQRMMLSK